MHPYTSEEQAPISIVLVSCQSKLTPHQHCLVGEALLEEPKLQRVEFQRILQNQPSETTTVHSLAQIRASADDFVAWAAPNFLGPAKGQPPTAKVDK
jgi:hypothetical protein